MYRLFLSALVEEVSEIAGPVIQWSATAAEALASPARRNKLIDNPKPLGADNDAPVTPTDTKVSIDTIVQLFRPRASGLIASVCRIGINRRWGQFY